MHGLAFHYAIGPLIHSSVPEFAEQLPDHHGALGSHKIRVSMVDARFDFVLCLDGKAELGMRDYGVRSLCIWALE